jgi:hypothetical protein
MVVNIITYEVTIKTNRLANSDTRDPIYITFIGTYGTSPQKLLSDQGFGKGTLNQVTIDSADVGLIYGITLNIKGFDSWKPEEIIVKKAGVGSDPEEKIFKIPAESILESPDKPLTLKLPKPETYSNESNKADENEFNKEKIIELSCNDRVKDNDKFGPNYVTTLVNYAVYYARCPSNCMHFQERSVGLGIHPEDSPICFNAIVGRAISFYGGIIAISIYPGLPSYTGGKKM